jgi:hypothetical protein
MILHLVLYRPRPGLGAEAADGFLASLRATRAAVPEIRAFWVGRRLTDGPAYKMTGFPDYPFVAVVAFDDREGLVRYLQHPLHATLGHHFNSTAESALIYDFEVADAAGDLGGMIGAAESA